MKNFKLIYTMGVIFLSVLLTLGIASLILAVLGADVLKTFWVIFCYPFTTFKNISGVINTADGALLVEMVDRKSTRLNPVTVTNLVCRLLLEKKN